MDGCMTCIASRYNILFVANKSVFMVFICTKLKCLFLQCKILVLRTTHVTIVNIFVLISIYGFCSWCRLDGRFWLGWMLTRSFMTSIVLVCTKFHFFRCIFHNKKSSRFWCVISESYFLCEFHFDHSDFFFKFSKYIHGKIRLSCAKSGNWKKFVKI